MVAGPARPEDSVGGLLEARWAASGQRSLREGPEGDGVGGLAERRFDHDRLLEREAREPLGPDARGLALALQHEPFQNYLGRDRDLVAAHAHSVVDRVGDRPRCGRSEEHTSELQSLTNLVCRLLLEKKKK